MVRAPHDLPGVAVIENVAAPGKCLVATFSPRLAARSPSSRKSATARSLPPSAIGDTFEQTRIGAQLRHDVELAFRPVEETRPMRFRRGLEAAERLEEGDPRP
jgi:hypothetical protein